jgi:hypothetical protein
MVGWSGKKLLSSLIECKRSTIFFLEFDNEKVIVLPSMSRNTSRFGGTFNYLGLLV